MGIGVGVFVTTIAFCCFGLLELDFFDTLAGGGPVILSIGINSSSLLAKRFLAFDDGILL